MSGVDPAIADAEKRREAAVLKRLRVMQKKRRREDRDAVNCAVEATTDNTAAVTGSPHLSPSLGRQRNNNVLLRGNLRTEKELKKREKEKRRSERAKIREERARRREKRQHAQ